MDSLWLILAVLYLAVSKCSSDTDQVDCSESATKPSEETLKQMYRAWLGQDNDIHSTFDLIQPLYQTRYKDNIPDARSKVLRQRIHGSAKCHKRLRRKGDELMDISLCPWYVEITVDMDRYPEIMADARCTCKHCYDFDGLMPDETKRIGRPRCKEIKQRYKVLKVERNSKGAPLCQRNGNIFLYKNSYEEVTIGCTCALVKDKIVPDHSVKTES